ncbi:phospholipase D beta 1-like protein [Tanacetum coccineum]
MLELADAMLQPAEPILREVGLQMQKWEVRYGKVTPKMVTSLNCGDEAGSIEIKIIRQEIKILLKKTISSKYELTSRSEGCRMHQGRRERESDDDDVPTVLLSQGQRAERSGRKVHTYAGTENFHLWVSPNLDICIEIVDYIAGMIVDDELVLLGSTNINHPSPEGTSIMGAYQPHQNWARKGSNPSGQATNNRRLELLKDLSFQKTHKMLKMQAALYFNAEVDIKGVKTTGFVVFIREGTSVANGFCVMRRMFCRIENRSFSGVGGKLNWLGKPNWGGLPDGVGGFDEEDELGFVTPRRFKKLSFGNPDIFCCSTLVEQLIAQRRCQFNGGGMVTLHNAALTQHNVRAAL